MIDRSQLSSAFVALRKAGFVARQNFSCCQGCATAALTAVPENIGKKAVFFTKQDGEGLEPRKPRHLATAPEQEVYMTFGIIEDDTKGDDQVKAVGEEAVKILKAAGLKVEWNGDAGTRLLVRG